MTVKGIRLGLPTGSLNHTERGHTEKYLKNAGYLIIRYSPGMELFPEFRTDDRFHLHLVRPQEGCVEIRDGILDATITGNDWFADFDYLMQGEHEVQHIGDFGYGRTNLHFITRRDNGNESLGDTIKRYHGRGDELRCYTEYLNLARKAFAENKFYQDLYGEDEPTVFSADGGFKSGKNDRVVIKGSLGKTEQKLIKDEESIILDNVQSGRTIREMNLRTLDYVMSSSAGLYAGPQCSEENREALREFYEMVKGSVLAEDFVFVHIDVPNRNLQDALKYLKTNRLFVDEPTVKKGRKVSAIDVEMPKSTYRSAAYHLWDRLEADVATVQPIHIMRRKSRSA